MEDVRSEAVTKVWMKIDPPQPNDPDEPEVVLQSVKVELLIKITDEVLSWIIANAPPFPGWLQEQDVNYEF